RALSANGIAVMAHVGLTPQRVAQLGGFKVQAKTAQAARQLIDDSLALEDAGAFAIVLESVPAAVGALATGRLSIPTIGIGAGVDCDGQVLVLHDVLGLYGDFKPKFAKRFAEIGSAVVVATKPPGTEWAANVAAKILGPGGVALTIQNGLGNYEIIADHVGHDRAAVGVIYVGAQLEGGTLRATGPGRIEIGPPENPTAR